MWDGSAYCGKGLLGHVRKQSEEATGSKAVGELLCSFTFSFVYRFLPCVPAPTFVSHAMLPESGKKNKSFPVHITFSRCFVKVIISKQIHTERYIRINIFKLL